MNNTSVERMEQAVEAGEEVIDRYFDATTTRVGLRRQMTSRRNENSSTSDLEMPEPMLSELDAVADELNISRQAVIKMMLRRALDEHYLAKRQLNAVQSP